ncbi:asparagine synthase (glutamine-hydrolyzing) [Planotetraspora mira]|uniref:asparagine synthase (glutamine-hydrolyzing) n=1 Tax=Planotetraspora mira TaxID=58121 RepID=A0A8J3XBC0_9ACTN|nr:asparagine synthase (glutamine-hydrolyzing) [Planotetraspora mira]GII34431.1 asparagine synthetase B [Planotetraspora mira]
MCAITGWVSFERDLGEALPTLEAMTLTMARRGPDDHGTWVAGHAALGHRRLAIIDLPGGRQPMSVRTPEGDVALVYSGETYNFAELRRELLRRGHTLRTTSDTEVVLHGYLEWGEAVAEHLNGMFAFAIWDGRRDTLVMVRDRMGVKPLFYHPTSDGVLFGSEPKAILANPLAETAVGLDGLREMFAFVRTPGLAIWKGMREVEPGTVVSVGRDGIRVDRYWSLRTAPHTDDRETTVARVRDLLEDIVGRQLVADVPRCTLLSGGLDSSALTAIAARRLSGTGERLRSFAVDFAGQEENFVATAHRATRDAPYVHDVAELSGTDHEDIVLGSAALADPGTRADVIRARDAPVGLGDMDASLHLLFSAVRRHSTVALSGESADEVFGGYRQFFDPKVRQADTFPWLASFAGGSRPRTFLDPGLSRALDLGRYIGDAYGTAVAGVGRLDGESDLEHRMRRISYLYLTRFVRVLLDRKDRASMAVGLEVRVPFCDHRLVEYVYNVPWALKSYDGREKSLLRGATADLLPQSVVDRTKSPYPSTQDPAYTATMRGNARDLLADPADPVFGLIDRDGLRRAVDAKDPRVVPLARRLFERALDLSLWLRMYRPVITTS